MKIRPTKNKPNYEKIREELEKMMFGAAFDCPGSQNLNQLPIIVDALAYFMATADGNAFTQLCMQYRVDAKEILSCGIKEYMKKYKMDKSSYGDDFGLKHSLNLCLKELEKKEGE